MDAITQEDNFGCGAACVAFVTGKSYNDVVVVLGENKAREKGFYCREIQAYLRHGGAEYEFCYAKPHKRYLAYKEGSIVFIKRSKRFPAGHYLVFSQGKWMDPWRNFCSNKDIREAYSGYRKRLPGVIQYILYRK